MTRLSIIIPALNESANIRDTLTALAVQREHGVEVIVVDGGSADGTRAVAAPLCDRVVDSPPGRSAQMNAGCEYSQGDTLLFLHADTRLPQDADRLILDGLARSGRTWGRFDVTIEGRPAMLRVIAWFMNHRSRLTGIATGDQALFVTRDAFERAGRYANIRLMEDIALCKTLKRTAGPPLCLTARVTTSGRRWEKHGVWRTIWLMWTLRARYALGADPDQLHADYYGR
ncbi:MAG: TIGR04283 family arsenosugar biosynthesis glycosyltransferase [Betaproteobacteria bacterium]|nr:TIGR04283 family arsenosugar biosynthesis glycosyltransferase [Betaproteobacteria bacterium]